MRWSEPSRCAGKVAQRRDRGHRTRVAIFLTGQQNTRSGEFGTPADSLCDWYQITVAGQMPSVWVRAVWFAVGSKSTPPSRDCCGDTFNLAHPIAVEWEESRGVHIIR